MRILETNCHLEVQSPPNNLEILGRSPEQYCRPISSVASIFRRVPGSPQLSPLNELHLAGFTVRGGFWLFVKKYFTLMHFFIDASAYIKPSTSGVRLAPSDASLPYKGSIAIKCRPKESCRTRSFGSPFISGILIEPWKLSMLPTNSVWC